MIHGEKTVEGIVQLLCKVIWGHPEIMSRFYIGGEILEFCDMPDEVWEVFSVACDFWEGGSEKVKSGMLK
jgi:hypothetical protein